MSRRLTHRSRIGRALVASLLVIGIGAATTGCESPYPTSARAQHVILVGFDGFDPAYLDRVATPNLDALAARGQAGEAISVAMPYTMPSFTAITTGAWPENSGVITDYWDRTNAKFVHDSPDSTLTTIAQHVRANGGTVAAVRYPTLNGHGVRTGDPEALYAAGGSTCTTRFDTAIDILHERPVASGSKTVTVPKIPNLLAVYCSELDAIGHAKGAEHPDLDAAMITLDDQIGRLTAALDELGIADETTVIVSGDHGMSSYTGFVGLPMYNALQAAGYTMSYLWLEGQQPTSGTNIVVTPFGGRGAGVYLIGDLAGDEAALADVRTILDGLDELGPIHDRQAQQDMHMHPDIGDLVVEASPGWGVDVPTNGPLGGHGSEDELTTVFVAGGAGIEAKSAPMTVSLRNIGPTIAYLLGLDPLPDADAGPAFHLFTQTDGAG